jgi:hypothetical protein
MNIVSLTGGSVCPPDPSAGEFCELPGGEFCVVPPPFPFEFPFMQPVDTAVNAKITAHAAVRTFLFICCRTPFSSNQK